jgi:hypothetical protein
MRFKATNEAGYPGWGVQDVNVPAQNMGGGQLNNIPPAPRGTPQIEVTFEVDYGALFANWGCAVVAVAGNGSHVCARALTWGGSLWPGAGNEAATCKMPLRMVRDAHRCRQACVSFMPQNRLTPTVS